MGAAHAGTIGRSAAECLTLCEDRGRLRHTRRVDVRQRLERRPARPAVRGVGVAAGLQTRRGGASLRVEAVGGVVRDDGHFTRRAEGHADEPAARDEEFWLGVEILEAIEPAATGKRIDDVKMAVDW